jgi:ParB-like chromosome segregation protein Spo0J
MKRSRKTPRESQWRSRIVGHGRVSPDSLVPHPLNFRTHPAAQADALRGSLGEVGFIRSVMVNKRNNRVLDGHLRLEEARKSGQVEIDVEYVDLNEEEERLALATIDPLSALAETDPQKLAALIEGVQTSSEALGSLLAQLSKDSGDPASDQHNAKAVQIPPSSFEVVVGCKDEAEQRELFERLSTEGWRCRVLTF